jgi:hypothetical protein
MLHEQQGVLLGIKVDTGGCVGVRGERGGAAVYTTVLCPSTCE